MSGDIYDDDDFRSCPDNAETVRAERRAQFACAAMQGLIMRGLFDADPRGAAVEAVYFADALLAALEKVP